MIYDQHEPTYAPQEKGHTWYRVDDEHHARVSLLKVFSLEHDTRAYGIHYSAALCDDSGDELISLPLYPHTIHSDSASDIKAVMAEVHQRIVESLAISLGHRNVLFNLETVDANPIHP